MATIRILGLAFCLFVTVSAIPRRRWYEDNVERELEDLRRRQLFECKAKFEQCSGYPKCCGDLHCFWEGGYSPLRSGVCSECIDRTQPCQMTEQCCSPLVCQRENAYHVNGVCDVKRALLAECHKDSQCESGYCDIGWPERIKGQGGKCRNRQSRRTYLFDDDEEK